MNKRARSKSTTPSRPTIHDVAAQADVSIYTVSRTLNNIPGVNPETRERVLEVCRRLKMRPRRPARRKQFALVIQSRDRALASGYTAMLAFQLLVEVSARGMGLTLFCDEDLPELPRMLFDGILAVTWNPEAIEVVAALESTPTVVINRFSLANRFHVVGWDHTAEGRTVAEYLLGLGHKKLAIIAEPPPGRNSTQSRLSGYRDACAAARLPLAPARIELLESREHLALALGHIVAAGADAVYVPGQGRLGPEAVQLLQTTLRLRIPEDISVVSGEHTAWSGLFNPPLTTVDAPLEELARRSVDHLLALIENRATQPADVLLGTPIIERKSVLDRRSAKQRN